MQANTQVRHVPEVNMASGSAILAASKAIPGGASRTMSPQQMQGPYIGRMSPLVQQLSNEHGYANLYGGFLPRPPQTFTDGAFSPFSPIMPVPIDAPPPGYERPEPRRFQYEVGYNLPVGDPGTEGGYKLAPFSTLKSLSKTYCLDPGTRILCSDLIWRALGELALGDEIVAFDEEVPGRSKHRKMRTATVISCHRIIRPCYRLRFTDGREVIASAEHLWLSGRRRDQGFTEACECDQCGRTFKRAQALGVHRQRVHGIEGWWKDQNFGTWVATDRLRPGSVIRDLGKPWEPEVSWEAGYLAGVFDGEASLSSANAHSKAGWGIDFSQLPGAVLHFTERLLKERGYHTASVTVNSQSGVAHLRVSGAYDSMRLLGECRPVRLLEKVPDWLDGRSPARCSGAVVESVEFLGDREVVAIGTSTRTLIAEGLFSHNSIARRCIQLVKKEVCGLDWDISMTSSAEKAYQGNRAAQRDFGERRAQAMRFFRKPDPDYFDFTSWLSAMLEQVLTIDALSLYMCPKKGTGLRQGLLGSDLDGLWVIDGATIRPLLSLHGGMPMPPAPAYQQYEYGVPRADFTTVMAGLDLPEITGGERGAYRGDQLMYLPMVPSPDSPYGFGPTEQALVPILTGLRKQGYQLEFFTEGTVPAVYISPGDTSMTPNQIRELQDSLNSIANDQAFHWKVIVLPPGSKTMPQKPNDIVDQSDEWIANEVCMMYGVSPMDVGILPKVSTVASPFAAREMAQASRTTQEKTDTRPLLKFLSAIPNFILQTVCDQQDMEFAFEGQREIQDEAALTDTYVKQAQIGVRSVDEFRDKIGLPPWGLPESSGPVVFTPMGPIPLQDAVALAQAQAQQKALPPGGSSSGGKKKPAASAKPAPSMTNVGRQRARGGAALTPAHAASEGFMPERAPKKPSAAPAHPQASVKMAHAELEALTRHLRKGREITTWEPRNLEPRVLALISEQIAKGATPVQAADLVKTIVLPPASYAWAEKAPQQQAQARQQALAQQYAARIQAAFGTAAAAAAKLILAWAAGTLAVTAAALAILVADLIRKALQDALTSLWEDAWKHGEAEAGGSDKEALEAFLATWGRQALEWVSATLTGEIAGALHDLAGLKRKELITRLLDMLGVEERSELIAITEIIRAWNAAILAVWKMAGIAYKGWQTRNDAKVCAKCRANQDAGFIPLDAPFPSGNAAPGAHPRCRCWLIAPPPDWKPPAANKATRPDDMEAFQDRGEPVRQRYGIDGTAGDAQDAPHPFTRDGDYAWCVACGMPRSHPVHPANKKRKRGVNLDGEVVIADVDPSHEAANPAGGGGRTQYPHRGDGTEVPGGVPGSSAGGEPPRWDASTPERRGYVNAYGEDDAEWPEEPREVPGRPDKDYPGTGTERHPRGGHGTGQAPATSIGDGSRGRPPNGVGKAANAAAEFLKDAPKAKASAVRKVMLENFPPEALAWVGRAKWVGPVEIPIDLMDLSGRKKWAANHQTGHVNDIARDLKAGKKVNPIIGVVRPSHNHIRLVDGRHRTLACEKNKMPVRGYVGFLDSDADLEAAYDSYHYQRHPGDDPANK